MKKEQHEQQDSHIPEPPKGTKISKRMKMLFMIGAIVAVILVVVFIKISRPHVNVVGKKLQSDNTESSQVNTLGMINKINQQPDSVPGILSGQKVHQTDSNVAVLGQSSSSSSSPADNENSQSLKQAYKSKLQVSLWSAGASIPSSYSPQSTGDGADASPGSVTVKAANSNKYQQQNMQSQKAAFLQKASNSGSQYLNQSLQTPESPYEVQAGSIIPAELVTGINSDLPGPIVAIVRKNVYDTSTGNHLLIPQGSKLMGTYDSQVAYGQSRVLIAWSYIKFPNGDSFNLAGMPGVDLAGMAGLHDEVDNHYVRIFGSALLFSLFGAAGRLSQPQQSTTGVLTNQQIISASIGQQFSQTGAQLTQKNLNIQPTIKIRPGDLFNVFVTKDMVFPGPYKGA